MSERRVVEKSGPKLFKIDVEEVVKVSCDFLNGCGLHG